jgi:PAS domain S-box-containing protein
VPNLDNACFVAFDVLPDAVIAADEEGTIWFVNRAATRLLGWTSEELRGRKLNTLMPPRMQVAHEAGLRRYSSTHHPRIMGRPIRVPALRRDGTEVDVELTLAAACFEPGRDFVVGTLRDLSDRVEVERQLVVMEHMRAATAAAAYLNSLLDVHRVCAVAVDTLVSQFDAALARIWLREGQTNTLHLCASAGLSRRTTGSPRERIDMATHPFKIGMVARTRRPFAKNGLEGDTQFDQDWVKREKLQAATAFPLIVGNELRGVVVAFFRHFLEPETFEVLSMLSAMVATAVHDANLYDDAHRALRARDEVLAVVSHDLRNPLSIIELAAGLVLRRCEEKDDCREAVLRIRRAGERMTVLIRDLLDVSAIDAGRLRVEPSEQAIGPLVLEAIDLFRPLADEKHIGLTADVHVHTDKVWCDRCRIVQVFSNLLGNAIKYTSDGGAITVSAVEDDRAVTFAVTDSGCGIAEDQLQHVFDRYWQGHERVSGVGLGLAIAKGIVEAHHGAIRAESTRGSGSRFVFELPRAA